MTLPLDQDLQDFRDSVRAFLARHSAPEAVRELMESPAAHDRAVWTQMSEQLGLQGLQIPEEHGGSGFAFVAVALVMEEAGRVLLCAPYLATAVLAVNAVLLSEDAQAQARFLPHVASGETVATLAYGEVRARETGDGWRLDGRAEHVLDGCVADELIVVAGDTVVQVSGTARGLTRTPLRAMDQTRRQAHLDFQDVGALLVGAPGDGARVLRQTLDRAAVALAAEQAGVGARALEMAVAYAGEREQFGRPIGSFQAIKHKCADVLVEVECARSCAYAAAAAVDDDAGELDLLAPMAKALCSEAAMRAAAENVQIHGGIGYTWEHDAQLYFKRAAASEVMFGAPAEHRELLANRLAIA